MIRQALTQRLHLLHRGEHAQGMVFGAISLFMLAACIGLVHNSGVVISRRIRVQTAADAAAYAGSLTTANIISDMAWMNDGMAYIYYNLMRYAVDVTVYRTVVEMGDHNRWRMRDGEIQERDNYDEAYPKSPEYQQLVSAVGGDPAARYVAAYERAEEMVPRGEKWLQIMSDMEHALAIAGKYLIREAVFRTASEKGNKTDAVAMVQNTPFGPVLLHASEVEDIDMTLEYDPDGNPLWSITYNGAPYMEIYKHGPDHWEIVRPGVQSVEIFRHTDDHWTIKTGDLVTEILRHPDGTLEVTTSGAASAHLLCIPMGDRLWAIAGQTNGVNVDYKPFRDGGYLLTVNGETIGIRNNGGVMEQFVDGRWEEIPGQGSINVGGEEIPINFSGSIDLNPPEGVPSLSFPGTLNLGPMSFTLPNQVRFAGTTVTLAHDTVSITAQVGNVALIIDGDADNCVSLNGRSTCDPNSENKRGYWVSGVYGHDRIETVVPGRKWIYKWRQIRAILTREDLNRFGHHAVQDAALNSRVDNTWTQWFNVGTGQRKTLTSYHQTVPCWHAIDRQGTGVPDGIIRTTDWTGDGIPDDSPCPICNPEHPLIDYDQQFEKEIDNDGDGIGDVRKYGMNMLVFKKYIENPKYDRDFQSIQLIDTEEPHRPNIRPYCLTDSVFAHPLIVAVWARPDKPFLGAQYTPPIDVYRNDSGEIAARRTGANRWIPLFRNPEWGYFAVACSRVGVLSGTENHYDFTFDQEVDRNYTFDFGADEFAERLENRSEWLASWHNLYEPVWTARLWTTAEAVRSVDMEIAERQQELDIWEDVSKNFVWRTLQGEGGEEWRWRYHYERGDALWYDPNSEEVCDPADVPEAWQRFMQMRGPHNGRFLVNMNTDPDLLQGALQH